jgi:hypothetical protein
LPIDARLKAFASSCSSGSRWVTNFRGPLIHNGLNGFQLPSLVLVLLVLTASEGLAADETATVFAGEASAFGGATVRELVPATSEEPPSDEGASDAVRTSSTNGTNGTKAGDGT